MQTRLPQTPQERELFRLAVSEAQKTIDELSIDLSGVEDIREKESYYQDFSGRNYCNIFRPGETAVCIIGVADARMKVTVLEVEGWEVLVQDHHLNDILLVDERRLIRI